MLNGFGIDEMFLIGIIGVLFVSPKQLAQLLHWVRTTRGKINNMRYDFEDKMEKMVKENLDPDSMPRVQAPSNIKNGLDKDLEVSSEEVNKPEDSKEAPTKKPESAAQEVVKDETTEIRSNSRKNARNRLQQLNEEEREDYSEQLIKKLNRWDKWIQSATVALYLPIQHEVDIKPLIEAALKMGKIVYLPYIDEINDFIGLAPLENIENDLVKGAFNILEPKEELRDSLDPEEIELFLVPGIAFGESGQRLGRGKGWYDRLLSRFPQSTYCGIAYDFQILSAAQLPQIDTDIAMNVVFTEERMIKCGKKT